jgi:hypothetical protein
MKGLWLTMLIAEARSAKPYDEYLPFIAVADFSLSLRQCTGSGCYYAIGSGGLVAPVRPHCYFTSGSGLQFEVCGSANLVPSSLHVLGGGGVKI